jgi:hypothetical protein
LLKPVQSQRPLDAPQIKVVGPKNFDVAKLVAQTQPVVGLELVPVAGSANALKVFSTVWIAGPQAPDQPGRHDVVDMPSNPRLAEIGSARLDLAMAPQCRLSVAPPLLPGGSRSRPLPVQVVPGNWPLLSAEALATETTTPQPIHAAPAVESGQEFRSPVSTKWAMHLLALPLAAALDTKGGIPAITPDCMRAGNSERNETVAFCKGDTPKNCRRLGYWG